METDSAGLDCVKKIRDELQNKDVRIILRTGQPGQAPENDVIINYDINDYKLKTDLTAQKMCTTIVSALRTFMYLKIIEKNRKGLERIIQASGNLFQMKSFNSFAFGILNQLTNILQSDENSMMVTVSGVATLQKPESTQFYVLAGTGKYAGKEHYDVSNVVSRELYER
jgi:response regulator RpfG family c-di-GMP phosphodiesterase